MAEAVAERWVWFRRPMKLAVEITARMTIMPTTIKVSAKV
jgi:hypothetical protein